MVERPEVGELRHVGPRRGRWRRRDRREPRIPLGVKSKPDSCGSIQSGKPVAQGHDGRDFRNLISTALPAGRDNHSLPVLPATGRPVTFQPDHAALGKQRLYPRNAKLDRLLHRVIHAIAGRYALGETDLERRLPADGLSGAEIHFETVTRHSDDGACVLVPDPVENSDRITLPQAADTGRMMRCIGRKYTPAPTRIGRSKIYTHQWVAAFSMVELCPSRGVPGK